ncbi:MAG: hypothetical protein ACM3RP_14150, partial [Chitinophagales bacterium]
YPTSSPGSLDTLVSQGYLKVKPECVTADGVSHIYEWKTDFAGTTFTFQAVGGNPVTLESLDGYGLSDGFKCPSGGQYKFQTGTNRVLCSVHDKDLW